jgi:histidinol phosphatase-like PHP family hydrolase
MTRRIIHACENPNVTLIGHPSTRLIGRRAHRRQLGRRQRGWLTPDDVINTWPLDRLQEFLHRKL